MFKSVKIPIVSTYDILLPTSKSVAAREMMLAALTIGESAEVIESVSGNDRSMVSDDIRVLCQGLLASSGACIDVDASGTALRFLTAYWAAREGSEVTLTGNARLCQRPIAPLVDALRQLGADIHYVEHEGFAPLRISGRRLHGGRLVMPGDVSSQFVSALLMIAPVVGGIELQLTGDIVSRPYIDMTIELMRRHGVNVEDNGQVFVVPSDTYMPAPANGEGDWSAAAFWLALQAMMPNARIILRGLQSDSVQGDRRFLTILEQMGMAFCWNDDGSLTADMNRAACCCCSTFADLSGTPDLAPVLVVMLCLMGRPFRLTGLRTLRHKESDRREALRQELAKLGYVISLEGEDGISWHFATCPAQDCPVIDTHGDHRIAMAMALAAVKHPGLTIADAQVVSKSYPNFWQQLMPETEVAN